MDYKSFLERKNKLIAPVGFDPKEIHPELYDFQAAVTRWALRRGRAAIFAGTGLGKTIMQSEFARHMQGETLILAPLAVVEQTREEAKDKLGLDIHELDKGSVQILNYENLHHVDPERYTGIILDESSILKSFSGAIRNQLIQMFAKTPYRLSCTATPAPNDFMEIGNQAEFLGICSRVEMLAEFFIHDGGETAKWRLKGHAKSKFWEWMASWSMMFNSPYDLGFDGSKFVLPPIEYHEIIVEAKSAPEGFLFADTAIDLQGRIQARRETTPERCEAAAKLANTLDGVMVWCGLNNESELLSKLIDDSVEVKGSDAQAHKLKSAIGFANRKINRLISKSSIFGYGLNLQKTHNQIFVGLSDSWEEFFQAVRRQWRFGQKKKVNVWLIVSEREGSVLRNIKRKEKQALEMQKQMIERMAETMKKELGIITANVKAEYVEDEVKKDKYHIYQGDSCELIKQIPDESIDFSIFSPPFSSLYTYSNSDRDIGNARSDSEFTEHYKFLAQEQFRIHRPGRVMAVHCMDLPAMKERDGYIGVKDFPGLLIRLYEEVGFTYDGRITIWKNPVTAMQRTKSIRLLHKQIKKDSAMSGVGLPDYVLKFKKPGENIDRIEHTAEEFPVSQWQEYASPVWMDINPSDTLQYTTAREDDDERHIAPLQLSVIERCATLWSKPGDVCFTPFMGIGSECYTFLKMGRQAIGIELKGSYFKVAAKNCHEALSEVDLFAGAV